MATRKPVVIDGTYTHVNPSARLSDVVSSEVQSVMTQGGEVIPRSSFASRPVPDGFETNLTRQEKGAIC